MTVLSFPRLRLRAAHLQTGWWPAFARRTGVLGGTLLLALWGLAAAGGLAAADGDRDPVAHWEAQRVARGIRLDRLPHAAATMLIIPLGSPPPAVPERLTRQRLDAVIEKIDEYSGPAAPEHIDAVLFEINALGELDADGLDRLLKLTEMLQVHDYPVYAWIHNTAFDEAAWVALASDRIFYAPLVRFGGGPSDPLRDPAEQYDTQVLAFTQRKAAFAADLAANRGYNSDVAAAMIDASTVLHRVTLDGQPCLLTEATMAAVRKQRPDAVLTVGPVYKKGIDRLIFNARDLARSESGLDAAPVASRADLWQLLQIKQVRPIELQFAADTGAGWQPVLQVGALAGVVLLSLFLLICELWMETRGYALISAAGLIFAYLLWAAFHTPLGLAAMVCFPVGVGVIVGELRWPTRRGLLGIAGFAVLGLGLALTLIPDPPWLDATWRNRHLPSEYAPAVRNTILVLVGGLTAAAAIGLLAQVRLKHTVRYSRLWRKRFEAWDDSLFLTLQAQIGKEGRTRTALAPPDSTKATAPSSPWPPPRTAPDREPRLDDASKSRGEVEIDGRIFNASCTGAIAADQPVVVVDSTEERLIVRHLPDRKPVVPPWQSISKYEADPAHTKYADQPASRYGELERKLGQAPLRYTGIDAPPAPPAPVSSDGSDLLEAPPLPATDGRKYPPKTDGSKYRAQQKRIDGSKYAPGEANQSNDANDANDSAKP